MSYIPGTRVPDTPIHRASLWWEQLEFGGRDLSTPERMDAATAEALVEELVATYTAEQLHEAATYYGRNWAEMILGPNVGLAGVNANALFTSVWLDGFAHGAGTQARKYGTSRTERT